MGKAHREWKAQRAAAASGLKPATVKKPLISENTGILLVAGGTVAYLLGYQRTAYVALGVGVLGILNGNLLI